MTQINHFTLLFLFLIWNLAFTSSSSAYTQHLANDITLRSSDLDLSSTRHYNIALMHDVLKSKAYDGYDILIISSTTEEEALYQQQTLEKAFEGTSKNNGSTPLILSVVDNTESGQLLGSIYTWLEAEKCLKALQDNSFKGFSSLTEYVRAHHYKVAIYHNGGKGERCSPLTQSLGNSRGAQKLVGTIKNAVGKDIELDVLLGVILQCSSFAKTNPGARIDTFWTSQIAFGSYLHDQLIRSNFGIDKFFVGFDKTHLVAQDIADFGTAALSQEGHIVAFYGNKRFASRKGDQYVIDYSKINHELLCLADRVAYDFGSFSTSLDMWQLLMDYWAFKGSFSATSGVTLNSLKRDIDPHFIQPFIRFVYTLNELVARESLDLSLPLPCTLKSKHDLANAYLAFEITLKQLAPHAYVYLWQDIEQENSLAKQKEATVYLKEVIEFYLLYRQSPAFKDLKRLFGCIDLGDQTQWFRYRRPIDIANEKLEMLTDLSGSKLELLLDGQIQISDQNDKQLERCLEARLMRNIQDKAVGIFTVEGKAVSISFSDMQQGKWIEGVYVKGSVIQNCNLNRGSFIINSVLNHVTGKVIAEASYLESSTSPFINAKASIVHQVVDFNPILADREIVSDVYRSAIEPAYHGRMRAPIGYDPKGMPIYQNKVFNESNSSNLLEETIAYFIKRVPYSLEGVKEFSDKTARTEDGRFTFEQIREISPQKAADKQLQHMLEHEVKKVIEQDRLYQEALLSAS